MCVVCRFNPSLPLREQDKPLTSLFVPLAVHPVRFSDPKGEPEVGGDPVVVVVAVGACATVVAAAMAVAMVVVVAAMVEEATVAETRAGTSVTTETTGPGEAAAVTGAVQACFCLCFIYLWGCFLPAHECFSLRRLKVFELLQPDTAASVFPVLRCGVSISRMLPRESKWRRVLTVDALCKAEVKAAARGRLTLVEDAS